MAIINPMRKFKKILAGGFFILSLMAGLVWFAAHKNFPIAREVLSNDVYGSISVARPWIRFKDLVVVFADTTKFQADDLARRIAQDGSAVAIFDTSRVMQAISGSEDHCLDASRIREPLSLLSKWAHVSRGNPSVVAGVGEGGLLPLLFAGTASGKASRNLSVGFSVNLPEGMQVCSPFTSVPRKGYLDPASFPALQGKWMAVWTYQPDSPTALFVRGLPGAKTEIAPYDTPLDTLAVHEIKKISAEEDSFRTNPLPVVEVPATGSKETLTLFYSGDGGWRDLDRAVAEQMAKLGVPCCGRG